VLLKKIKIDLSQTSILVGCSLLLCACGSLHSSYSNHYFPVINRDQRESTLGFSIAPPSGSGWYEKVNNDSLYYLKNIDSDEYAIYTKATEIHLDQTPARSEDFLQFVRKQKQLDAKSSNLRNVSLKVNNELTLSPLCVRYIQGYDDYGTRNIQHTDFVRVQKSGLVCMHPESPRDGVDMFYVESYRKSYTANLHFKEEGEAFLHSLQFKRKDG
jgi:hypothetical protein